MNRLSSVLCYAFLFVLVECTLAHRLGAEAESCYGHEIQHPSMFNPQSNKQACNLDSCRFEFRLIGEVNEADFSQLLDTEVAQTFILNCSSVYRFEMTISNGGYLIQARDSETFEEGSNIIGEWLMPNPPDTRYRILQCGLNSGATSPEFPNSVTHTNLADEAILSFYWRAPTTGVQIKFFYSIALSYNGFYFPDSTPTMRVMCGGMETTTPSSADTTTMSSADTTTMSSTDTTTMSSTDGETSSGDATTLSSMGSTVSTTRTSSASSNIGYQLGGTLMTIAITLSALLN